MSLPRSPDDLAFRAAKASDVEGIVGLVQSAYRGESSQRGWTTEAHLLGGQRTDVDDVVALLAGADRRIVLALQGDVLVGCCHVEREGGACHFGLFAVTPTLQRGGVGKALLAEAERLARDEWRCHEMQMTVIDVRAELLAWYERRGYVRTGEHAPFPYGNERFGLPKRDDLRFERLVKVLAR